MDRKFWFSVEISDSSNYNWMVVKHFDNGSRKIVCYIPSYYRNNREVALSVMHALECNPTKLNLEV